MKSIVIDAIESEVLFRPGNTSHAKYYAIITLNQTVLSSRDHDVANKLLNIYFAVFTSLLKNDTKDGVVAAGTSGGKHVKFDEAKKPEKMNKKAIARAAAKEKQNQYEEDINAKLISAVLTGVNRAFPFSKVDDDVFDRHMDTLFRITHSGNFNTGIQALMLIFQVSNSKQVSRPFPYDYLWERIFVDHNRRYPIAFTEHYTNRLRTNVSSIHQSKLSTSTFSSVLSNPTLPSSASRPL